MILFLKKFFYYRHKCFDKLLQLFPVDNRTVFRVEHRLGSQANIAHIANPLYYVRNTF